MKEETLRELGVPEKYIPYVLTAPDKEALNNLRIDKKIRRILRRLL